MCELVVLGPKQTVWQCVHVNICILFLFYQMQIFVNSDRQHIGSWAKTIKQTDEAF